MVPTKSGAYLYLLCYFQRLAGDVAEIGSWQGRSASFIARATREAGNGRFFAIDHFKGNIGKEQHYKVGKDDLSDLRDGFTRNMRAAGLEDSVTLYDMPSKDAAAQIADGSLRFLFIDGDHTREGVEKDLALFVPKLKPGAIVVFDDFSPAFPGVVSATDDFIARTRPTRKLAYGNGLVVELP
jgi:predicted O-methyltransferase YrrM